jgi:translocation and assembly module TamB
MLDASLRLTGPLDDPTGDLRANVDELRVTAGLARGLPPARLDFRARRAAGSTDVDAGIDAGPGTRLRVQGQVAGARPQAVDRLNLRAEGRIDLTVLDALLSAEGRQASGVLTLDGRISGQPDAPRLDGRLRIADAALYDRSLALALTAIDGAFFLAGDTLRVERLSGRAGGGSIAVTGSIGLLAEGRPVDLRLVARDAEPVQLDRLRVRGDAELSLRGELTAAMTLAGGIQLHRVDIGLPDRLPPTIVTLEVRERGATRRPRPAVSARAQRPVAIDLDLAVTAPRAVHVRGRGIEAELGGSLRARGPAQRPEIDGGFTLLRGDYALLGQRLRFTSGRIDFDGSAGLDPRLDLETRVTAAGSTAILAVRGRASAPRIELSGEPELPADEVLSRLLFGVAGGRLTAWQVAQVGRAAATLAGVGGEGPGLLRRARDRLGLENLWIGSGERGSATLEGGRYIADGLYIGARQGTHAGDAQGVLRMDLTPRIRLETDIGAARGARTGAAFELEY